VVVAALVACRGEPPGAATAGSASGSPGSSAAAPSSSSATPSGAAAGAGSASTAGGSGAGSAVAAPQPQQGTDFTAPVQLVYQVVACGADGALPDAMAKGDDARVAKLKAIVAEHCNSLRPYIEKFRTAYFDKARAWFVEHEPKDLPKVVVYPFGGGDLISALVAFPDATVITTISLELAGDPRHLAELEPAALKDNLYRFRSDIGPMIGVGLNSSVNLSDQQRNALAAQLASHLLGLVTGGYELVGARYFRLEDDGQIHYLEQTEIDADTKKPKSLRGNWKTPAFAESFANVEVQYRKPGESQIRVHRHIAWNLDNEHLKQPALLRYLEAKGKVAVLVKGAHYLLWLDDFDTMRKYILDHLVWMVSDSTGVPPNYAQPAGMVQEAYGRFDEPILAANVVGRREDLASRKLWSTPKGPIPFRFGYVDKLGHSHVMITRPK